MKRTLFLACFLLTSMFAFSQTFYKVVVNNVVVRTGPGKNYKAVDDPCGRGVCKLPKGTMVEFDGKVRNGYIHISDPFPRYNWGEGWIPLQNAKKAIKCPVCKGKGTTGRVCPDCDGEGYGGCCAYTGHEPCPKCGFIGYY